jgi:hypothetical protein
VSDPAEVLEQRPVELEIGAQHLGQGENPVAARDRGEHVASEELSEEEHLLLVTGGQNQRRLASRWRANS